MKTLIAIFLLAGCTPAQNPYQLSVHFRGLTNTAHILRGPDSSGEIQIGNTAARFTYIAVNCGPAPAAETPGR